ncbi:MAG: Gfo/Idh/MocA family oxidoreductase [Bacteroidetes bacterium]|nr:Gfo/Idh/MocA family oxidoreductase [Bacteroidota bacterium]
MKLETRRSFVKKSALAGAGLSMATSAASYARIIGSNERVNVALTGLNSRGKEHIGIVSGFEDANIAAICDVDSDVISQSMKMISEKQKTKPVGEKDYRKIVENKDIDAIFISSPDHTHTPFAIYGMQGGKNVYCEKPMCHNTAEGELLIAAQNKYGKVLQIGVQQRSAPTSIQAARDIREGLIGDVYMAKCWYANNRQTIGKGKASAVPDRLDWDLWQGPAPRRPYMDNIVHYNWHWFWHWGTGEVNNNGLHELDVSRWFLGVDHPTKVTSSGGRYFYKDDDWEFYDTQTVTYEYDDNKTIVWEGHSCNGLSIYDRGRGTIVYGTKGSLLVDRNDYFVYDLKGKVVKEMHEESRSETTNIVGGGALTAYHMQNFFNAIKSGEELTAQASDIFKSNHMCHLGNIAQKLDTTLIIDNKTGKILDNSFAMKMWGRDYEPGWEPVV